MIIRYKIYIGNDVASTGRFKVTEEEIKNASEDMRDLDKLYKYFIKNNEFLPDVFSAAIDSMSTGGFRIYFYEE
jgi:hypothetical protein